MKKILTLFALLIAFAVNGFAQDTWTVAGSSAVFGSHWDINDDTNNMTYDSNTGLWTLTKSNVTLTEGVDYEYKVVKNHSWDNENYGAGGNWGGSNKVFSVPESASYDVTITFDYENGKTLTENWVKVGTAQNAEITQVDICGEFNSWSVSDDYKFTKGDGDVYTLTLDLSSVTNDQAFKLVINGSEWLGYQSSMSIDAPAGWIEDAGGNDHNYKLKNSTTGYKTYTLTATWVANSDAASGWTLKIEGKDERVLEYYLVGELTGGWPENNEDQTKDVQMTKQTNGLYTYEVASFAAEARKYEYKLRANKIWGLYELPSSGNADYTFAEAGNYKLTFTANVTDAEIEGVPANTVKLDVKRILNTYTATFDNAANWEHVYAYTWTDGDPKVEQLGAWPGTEITKSGDVYSVSITAAEAPAKIIFHNNAGTQTEDFAFVDGQSYTYTAPETPTCYSIVGELTGGWHDNDTEDVEMTLQSSGLYTYEVASFTAEAKGYSYRLRANHKWDVFNLPANGNQVWNCAEAGDYKLTFTANVTGEAIGDVPAYTLKLDVVKIVETNTYTATFDNGGGWTNVYAYAWSGADESTVEQLGAWPGTKIDPISGVYTVTIDAAAAPEKIIFNNGRGIQTADLEFVNEQAYTYSVTVPGTALWSSEEAKAASWYSDPYDIVVSADKFENVKVGDKIHVAVQSVPVVAKDWNAQVSLKDGWWHDVEKAVNVGTGNVEIASFTVTGDMLRLFKERGMIVSGTNYSTKLVTCETTAITGSDLSIWVGSQNTNVEINKAHFQNANGGNGVKVGDVIRVTTEAAGWLGLNYNGTDWNWHEFADGAIEPINDWYNPYVDFVVKTEAAAQILNSDNEGIFVNVGDNPPLTVTQVELITFTGYYLATSESSWTTFTEMTETTEGSGVYTATVSGAGKFFAIVPNTAMTVEEDAIKTWKSVIRPNSTNDFVVDFANYSDVTKVDGDKVWQIGATNDADVTINYTPADGKFAISCQTEVEITDGYATYSNAQMYTVEGATANFVTVNSEFTKATLVPQAAEAVLPASGVNTVATGKGIVLSGSGPAIIKSVDLKATAVDATGNMLTGTGDYTFNLNANDYTAYLLQTVNGQTGFQKWNGDTTTPLAAHKAFLAIPNVTAGAPAFISFGGGTTGIEAVTQSQRTGQYYTLDGRRVENPTKGLYIINGKKVVIK